MLPKSLITFILAALVVHARPHVQPSGFWASGSMMAPKRAFVPCEQKSTVVVPSSKGIRPSDGNPQLQAMLEQERRGLSVDMPSKPTKHSKVVAGGKEADWARRDRRKRNLTDSVEVQDLRTLSGEVMDKSNDGSSPIEFKSSTDGIPLQKRHMRRKRVYRNHDYKMLDPTDKPAPEGKTAHEDVSPGTKDRGGEGGSVKGVEDGTREVV